MNPKTLRDATRIGALALAAGLAAALAGCGSGQPSGPASIPDPAPASQIGGDLTVYAAASLEPAFEQIGDWFVDEHPDVSIEFSYDGSSVLATQILSGAPVDVFTSADAPNMEKITSEARNDGEPTAFAASELAIAVAPGNPLGIEMLADLARAGAGAPVTVICAAEVPCGNASRALLERDGVELAPASEEQNVTAVLTKVREGEADAGLVYLSDILRAGDFQDESRSDSSNRPLTSPRQGEVDGIEIQDASDAAGDYLAVPIEGSDAPEAAAAFSEFLLTDRVQQLLADLGFGPAR
jgi:molybdate transport system substrate-binding protein